MSVATADPLTETAIGFHVLPIHAVFESPLNPRKRFHPERLKELADSIRAKGILEPLVVRSTRKGYEIAAGARRYKAALAADLQDLPCVVRTLTDTELLEIAIIENEQREDPNPLEQAEGYRALIDSDPTKHSAESIAARIGKSPQWVWDRMKLNDLVPEAKNILDQGLMTVGHAILIARLKPEDQARAIHPGNPKGYGAQSDPGGLWRTHRSFFDSDHDPQAPKDKYADLKPATVRELERWIETHVRFDVAHAAKAQPLKYEDTAAAVEQAEEQPGRGKKVIAITRSHHVPDAARDKDERTFGRESWKRADGQQRSKPCDHSVLGVFVAGEGQGETLRVCVARDKCLVHFGDVVRAKQKAAKLREQGKGKQAARTETKAAQREEDRYAKEQREREAKARAWKAVKPEACRLIREHLADVKFTAGLVTVVMDAGGELSSMRQVTEDFGVKLTPKTAALVLALATINTWDLEEFVETAKPWKCDAASVKTLVAAQLQPAGDKGKKPAKKTTVA